MDGGAPSEDQSDNARDRIVGAAVDLVLEHAGSDSNLRQVYCYLTPGLVAARAGVSRALIYHYWSAPGADAFSAFLADVASELWRRSAEPELLAAKFPGTPDHLGHVVGAASVSRFVSGEKLALLRAGVVVALAGAIDPADRDDVIERLSATFGRGAERMGMEPVPPLSLDDVAVAVTCVLMGFVLSNEARPERVGRTYAGGVGGGAERSLLAVALDGVIGGMLRPVQGSAA